MNLEIVREAQESVNPKHLPFERKKVIFDLGVAAEHVNLGYENEALQKFANAMFATHTAQSLEQRQQADAQQVKAHADVWRDPTLHQAAVNVGNLEAKLF